MSCQYTTYLYLRVGIHSKSCILWLYNIEKNYSSFLYCMLSHNFENNFLFSGSKLGIHFTFTFTLQGWVQVINSSIIYWTCSFARFIFLPFVSMNCEHAHMYGKILCCMAEPAVCIGLNIHNIVL